MSFLLRLLHRIPPLLTGLIQSLFPYTPRSSWIGFSFKVGGHSVHPRGESGLARRQRLVTIDKLPDDVLVEIFFYANPRNSSIHNPWHALVHVCRRWRHLVFASPRHLNLQLKYRGHRPMSEVLEVWPVLPVSLISDTHQSDQRLDNTVAALESEYYNRIFEVYIRPMTNSRWERFAPAMQKPFPELAYLQVFVDGGMVAPVLPESFLGGSAPRLRTLTLESISFPSLPKLLLSVNGLVELTLWDIPDSGYFSPDAMATALAVMTRLETLCLEFRSPRSRPDPESRPRPPPTRFALPALTELKFKGVYEYLEGLLARIDAPRLYYLRVIFFMDLDFDIPELHRFISHVEEFKTFDRADVWIFHSGIRLTLYPKQEAEDRVRLLELEIKCGELDYKLSSLTQVCTPSFPLISALERLQIREDDSSSHGKVDMENAQCLELLDPFTSLKDLYLYQRIARRVCSALQELSGERATEVLPALRNLFVRGFSSLELEPVQEAMMPFVAARQLSGHPVVVDHWKD